MKELAKELRERGTAEISNGVVNQVTQAIDEDKDKIEFMKFGQIIRQSIIPIDEACIKCNHCHFSTVKECQEHQGKDARARGFNKVICPEQFTEEKNGDL